jgi:hypothetical protein
LLEKGMLKRNKNERKKKIKIRTWFLELPKRYC